MRFWFNKKKEFNIDDCVPMTLEEVDATRKKIQDIFDPYIGGDKKDNINTFRRVADKYGVYYLTLEKFYYGEKQSIRVAAKLVKKLKEAGI